MADSSQHMASPEQTCEVLEAPVAAKAAAAEAGATTTAAQGEDRLCSVALLTLAWAGVFSSMTASVATVSLSAQLFAPVPAVENLPLACVLYSIGAANTALPWEFRHLGRRGAYIFGAILGFLGGLIVAGGCWLESFGLICLGACLLGAAVAHGQNYRFAATLLLPSDPVKAISWLLAGGVLGAILGPGVIGRARHVVPEVDFAGIYLVGAGVYLVVAMLLFLVRFPDPATSAKVDAAGATGAAVRAERSLREIFKQPRCLCATLGASLAFTIMLCTMAPTVLVMKKVGHSYDDGTYVMTVHMVLMYLPSPATGKAVRRWGTVFVMLAGCVVFALSGVALLVGTTLPLFYVGLALLGCGWNFLFLASTAQLTRNHTPAEGPKVQAVNDVATFVASGTFALASSAIEQSVGWKGTQVLVLALACATALLMLAPAAIEGAAEKRRTAAPEGCASPSP